MFFVVGWVRIMMYGRFVFFSMLMVMVVCGICIKDRMFFCICVLLVVENRISGCCNLMVCLVVVIMVLLIYIDIELFIKLKF